MKLFYIGTIVYAGLEVVHLGLISYSTLSDNSYVYWNTWFGIFAAVKGITDMALNIFIGK